MAHSPRGPAQPLTISTHHTMQAPRAGQEKATARVSLPTLDTCWAQAEGQSRNLSYSSSDYCGQPALLLPPDLGLQAVEASPVSAALRELLGLTEALRVL